MNDLRQLSAIKLALMAKRVRAEAQAVLSADPIAIVGMACRVPGGDDPEKFWQMLRRGGDAIRKVPADRWDADAWYDADPSAAGKASTTWGGFLGAIDGFDAAYFGIVPREADRMDPQQRLFLEVAIEAIDDAGIPRPKLEGARAGVYIASYQNDYAQLQYADLEAVDARTLTGTLHSVLANRLSYFLDLRGPSLSIDTACSSSLVATHLACQSLRSGECDVAIAGGVSLIVTPELMVSLSKVGFMAPDGRSKTFDARADGFGRGEGCGVIVLKRLADAIADGDRVLAVVRGSAVNSDGHSTLLAAPNGVAQHAMIVEALASAQLPASRIGFVETHGTGTALGDPIEVEALARTVGQEAASAGPCFLGAVKANIGHLEAAAGVAGLIKAIQALRHRAIPPQVHFTKLSPHIALAGTRFRIPTEETAWARAGTPRCAAVSSFGIGGTNAHVILEEAPDLPPADEPAAGPTLLALSAHDPGALRALVDAWIAWLPGTDAAPLDLAFTAGERRTHYDCRVAVVGRTREELADRLREHPIAGPRSAPLRVGFVFSGQGPQWYAMGRELDASEPVFHDVLAECDALLRPLSGWSLAEELAKDEASSRLDQTEIAQPALFAIQVALAALWKSWGIVPDGVVGHSVGEIAALHVAGVLTLAEAMRVVWHRGRIMQQATGLGRMAQLGLGAREAQSLVAPYGDRLSVGAINGPRTVVLSGEAGALEEALAAAGVAHRMLPVQYAFHSTQMAPFEERLVATLGAVAEAAPALEVFSTVTGERMASSFDARYFGRNVRAPVRFAAAIDAMAREGYDVFLEIGPHPVLAGPISECVEATGRSARGLASLRRQKPERETMLAACAGLYAAGATPAWEALLPAGQVVSLPAYPWQRRRHWLRSRPALRGATGAIVHPLLGRRVPTIATDSSIFEGDAEAARDWLADHRVFDRIVVPGAAILEALHAATELAAGGTRALEGFSIERPLVLGATGPTRWQVVVREASVELHEQLPTDPPTWQRIASAQSVPASDGPLVPTQASTDVPAEDFYARLAALGVAFGPKFRCVRSFKSGRDVAEGVLELAPELGGFGVHPILLDGALQVALLAADREVSELFLPLGADRVRILRAPPGPLEARAHVRQRSERALTIDVTLATPDGALVASFEGMRLARADAGAFAASAGSDDAAYEIVWRADPASLEAAKPDGVWLVFADDGGIGDSLARDIAAKGGRCRLVGRGPSYAKVGDGWTIDPADPEHVRRLFAENAWSNGTRLRGAVHLFALDVAPLAAPPGDRDAEDASAVGSLLHLAQSLVASAGGAGTSLVVVTRGAEVATGREPADRLRPRAAGAWGLASVIAVEHPELHVVRVDLDPADTGSAGLAAEVLATHETTTSVALRGGERWRPRLEHRARTDVGAQKLEVVRPGTLEGVELRPAPRTPLRAGEVRIAISASGLNFRDVLLALGAYPGGGAPLGGECVGLVLEVGPDVSDFELGARVFGFAQGSLGTEVVVPAAFLARVPLALSDDEAAAIPVAYLTAYYGLHRLAKLARGERVLIHAAAGGVGLAAVALARTAGAEIFATAGSDEKRALLRARGVQHVMDSRSLAFEAEIAKLTAGEGVHVVLNSLAGDFIGASLRSLGRGGRFLEMGKRGIMTVDEAARLRPDVTYDAFDLAREADADHGLLRPMFDAVIEALASGALPKLPITVFPLAEVHEALRFMAQAKHVGKIVLRVPHEAAISADATYLVTGGLGALGLETARWLARSGARHVALLGRGAPGAAAIPAIRELEAAGTKIHVFAADAGDRDAMAKVLADLRASAPPLRGVIHAAGVVDDAVLLRQTWDRCRGVLRGKAGGAFVLHELTRELPLDFFVLYGGAGVFLGASGQGAYPAANAELDALAAARSRAGLPALSVAWGAWADSGMAADLARRGHDVWAARGVGKITAGSAFTHLERLLRDRASRAAVLPIAWPVFLRQLSPRADRQFFASVTPAEASVAPRAPSPLGSGVVARLHDMPAGGRRTAFVAYLAERALHVLALDPSTAIDPKTPLKGLGLDSLMAVELRNTLAAALGKPLPATLLFDYPTLDALGGHLGKMLGLEEPEPKEEIAAPSANANANANANELAQMSDAEAEAALLKELEGT